MRSWCLYECAHTAPGCLQIFVGESHSNLAWHRDYRAAIEALSVVSATATYIEDKRMVDDLLVDKYTRVEVVDELLRPLLFHAFHYHYLTADCRSAAEGIAEIYGPPY